MTSTGGRCVGASAVRWIGRRSARQILLALNGARRVAVAKDGRGRTIGQTDIPTTPAGYRQVLAWAQGHGEVDGWAVEGTGSYGATEIGDINRFPGRPQAEWLTPRFRRPTAP